MAVTLGYLLVEDAPPAAVITLNRPEQLNALSTGLMKELTGEGYVRGADFWAPFKRARLRGNKSAG